MVISTHLINGYISIGYTFYNKISVALMGINLCIRQAIKDLFWHIFHIVLKGYVKSTMFSTIKNNEIQALRGWGVHDNSQKYRIRNNLSDVYLCSLSSDCFRLFILHINFNWGNFT